MQIVFCSVHGSRLQMHARLMHTMYYAGERAYVYISPPPPSKARSSAQRQSAVRLAWQRDFLPTLPFRKFWLLKQASCIN